MIKITFDKDKLIETITPMLCAVNERASLPALGGIYFQKDESDPTRCVLHTYDMERGMRKYLPCVIEEEGSFVINANRLQRIVRTMPGPNVTLEIDEKYTARIYSGTAEFKLKALPGEEFPKMPVLRGQNTFTVNQGKLKELIDEVSFAVAVNDQRIALNGAYFEVSKNKIKLCSCDGNKLAFRECEVETGDIYSDTGMTEMEFIVPGKTLTEAQRLLSDSGEVTVGTSLRNCFFFVDDTVLFSRTIDSAYIDYNRFIRKKSSINVYLSRDAFLGACERAALITEERTVGQGKTHIKCNFEGNMLYVRADNMNGSVQDNIPVEKEGDDLVLAFNCRYLMDALRACPCDSVKATLETAGMSMQLEGQRDDGRDKFLYMVLPVKLGM